MDRLWAGWRGEYIEAGGTPKDGPCVLCRVVEAGDHVVWRGERCAAILNAYPYGTGHLMVLPLRHVGEIEDLGDDAAELWSTVRDAVVTLKTVYRPDGVNVGANLGLASGAGVPGHLHIHVLPRWAGDTNFMTSVADTRVLPEALSVTRDKVRGGWTDA